jgi:alpha-glucoside transport system substrate-binding protein
VIWPTRGPALSYADQLQSLEAVGADASNYADALVSAGSSADAWLTIPVKVDPKSVVWYSPAAFEAAGYSVPTTWDDFVALADQMVADGVVPFSMGFESGDATGWTASDFIQDILLASQGPDYVANIINGSVAYDDAGVQAAYEIYVGWATDPAYAVGGAEGSLSTGFLDAIYKPFADPPEAMMVKQSGFAGGAAAEQFPELVQGTDYDFFPFPGAQGVQVGADFMSVFNDTPAVQAVVAYLTSADGGAHWASTGFGFTPNLGASTSDYGADQAALADFLASGAASPDLGDSIQPTFGSAEWRAIVDTVSGASSIEAALADAAAAQAADLGQ